VVTIGLAASLIGLLVAATIIFALVINGSDDHWLWMDYQYYRDLGTRWLADGQWYLPHQLAGPYEFRQMVDNLYPPPALLIFAPLAVLPAFVWWVVPIGVLAFALNRWRPHPVAISLIVLLLMWPRANGAFLFGNSDMWVAAGIAGGLLWGWPVALVALKPTFLPFLLLGVRRRSTFVAAAVLGLISLAMVPLWFDYIAAMRYLSVGWHYSLGSLPLMLVPIVAWAGRSRREHVLSVPEPAYIKGATAHDSAPA
jgi:hypothetical protein